MDKKVITLIKKHKPLENLVRILTIDQKIIETLQIQIETQDLVIKKITKVVGNDFVIRSKLI
jgi:hypothetical protein